jgi:predicted patatin/cPLA2 family phospholipase
MKHDLAVHGGGARGIVRVGGDQAFVARDHTSGRLLATSAGASTARWTVAVVPLRISG